MLKIGGNLQEGLLCPQRVHKSVSTIVDTVYVHKCSHNVATSCVHDLARFLLVKLTKPISKFEKMATKTNDAEMHFRVSQSDREKIKRLAEKAQMSVSEYVRKSALKEKVVRPFTDEEANLMLEVSRARADIRKFRNTLELQTKDYTPEARMKWLLIGNNYDTWAKAIAKMLNRLDDYWEEHITKR
jgi:uncharacterized protein (DUF1778 family)